MVTLYDVIDDRIPKPSVVAFTFFGSETQFLKLISYHDSSLLFFCFLFLVGRPSSKQAQGFVISNWMRKIFGRIVLRICICFADKAKCEF